MKRLLLIIGVLAMGVFVLAAYLGSSGETLYDCTSTLAADRPVYHVGDSIVLTFTLSPKRAKTVHFYTELHHTVVLSELEGQAFSPKSGAISKTLLTPDHPLVVSISGRVLAGPDKGTVLVDFGKFGHKRLTLGSSLELWARAYPAEIPTTDSVEWSWSNHVTILFAEDPLSNHAASVDAPIAHLFACDSQRQRATEPHS